MDTLEEITRDAYEARRDAGKATCHECGKVEGKTDLVRCSHLSCDRAVCCDCATELEWELEACKKHAYSVFCDMREMYRNALRRAQQPVYAERRAA